VATTKKELQEQIDKLANFIMAEVDGEPSESEGAVDCAIRIIAGQQEQLELARDRIWVEDWREDL